VTPHDAARVTRAQRSRGVRASEIAVEIGRIEKDHEDAEEKLPRARKIETEYR